MRGSFWFVCLIAIERISVWLFCLNCVVLPGLPWFMLTSPVFSRVVRHFLWFFIPAADEPVFGFHFASALQSSAIHRYRGGMPCAGSRATQGQPPAR